MSKAVLIEAIMRGGNGTITRAAASRAVDSMAGAVQNGLALRGRFALPGVGTFAVRRDAGRETRNSRTGKKIQIPAGKRVTFAETAELQAVAASGPEVR